MAIRREGRHEVPWSGTLLVEMHRSYLPFHLQYRQDNLVCGRSFNNLREGSLHAHEAEEAGVVVGLREERKERAPIGS